MLDTTDLRLLEALQENATATAQELSDRLFAGGLGFPTLHRYASRLGSIT